MIFLFAKRSSKCVRASNWLQTTRHWVGFDSLSTSHDQWRLALGKSCRFRCASWKFYGKFHISEGFPIRLEFATFSTLTWLRHPKLTSSRVRRFFGSVSHVFFWARCWLKIGGSGSWSCWNASSNWAIAKRKRPGTSSSGRLGRDGFFRSKHIDQCRQVGHLERTQ